MLYVCIDVYVYLLSNTDKHCCIVLLWLIVSDDYKRYTVTMYCLLELRLKWIIT